MAAKKSTLLLIPLLIGLSLFMSGCWGGVFSSEETITHTLQINPHGTVNVQTFNGPVHVEAAEVDTVEITITKSSTGITRPASEADLKNIDVSIQQQDERVQVIAQRVDQRKNHNSGVSINLLIPRTVSLELGTNNGEVKTNGVAGEIEVDTSNGRITVSGAEGQVDLQTSNGMIDVDQVSQGELNVETSNGDIHFQGDLAPGKHRFITSNGSIEIELPAGTNFLLDAKTRNGTVSSDFPLSHTSTSTKTELKGQSGEEPQIEIIARTDNGSININQGAGAVAVTEPPRTVPIELPEAVQAAISSLVQFKGVTPEEIVVNTFHDESFTDSCLGFDDPGRICEQGITPGFSGTMFVGDEQFEFRTNQDGSQIRLIPQGAFEAAQLLAKRLGVPYSDLSYVLINPVNWLDSCLAVPVDNQECKAEVTPGYQVILQSGGLRYEYHTDQSGNQVLLAVAPNELLRNPTVVWMNGDEESCMTALIGMEGINYGYCNAPTTTNAQFAAESRVMDLDEFTRKYASFDAETPAGKIKFAGQGSVMATQAEQRMIAEWSRLVTQEAEVGRIRPDRGLAIAYHLEGGIAGNCYDVGIYLSGEAWINACRNNNLDKNIRIRLVSSQLEQLYRWVDQLQSFEQTPKEPIPDDGFNWRLLLAGQGKDEVEDYEIQSIQVFAMELITQASTPQQPEELASAEQVLRDYFSALSEERYSDVVELYGGDYQVLMDNNPSISPGDEKALFEAACTINGHVCDLAIKEVVDRTQIGPNKVRFVLEFKNPDGSLFILGPCCGGTPQDSPPQSQFNYTLLKDDQGRFRVQDLPVYGG